MGLATVFGLSEQVGVVEPYGRTETDGAHERAVEPVGDAASPGAVDADNSHTAVLWVHQREVVADVGDVGAVG